MEQRLLTALVAGRPRIICGRRLRAFSLGHRFALYAAKSPLVTGKAVEISDLVYALRLCQSGNPLEDVITPTLSDKWLAARMSVRPSLFIQALADFREYLIEHTSHPELWDKGGKSESDNIDWPMHTLAALVRCGTPVKDALAMSEGLAVWLQVCIARQEGAELSVVSEKEKAMMAKLEELNRVKN